jgi:hypothetical protein
MHTFGQGEVGNDVYVITDKTEWEEFTKECLPIYGILTTEFVAEWNNVTAVKPFISIILETDDARYSDFVRVAADDSDMYISARYRMLYAMETMYMYCVLTFSKPAHLEVEFVLPVDTVREQLAVIAQQEMIGLGFVESGIIEEIYRGYDVVTIPTISGDAIIAACTLATVKKYSYDAKIQQILEQMLLDARNTIIPQKEG